ncbi:MAG: hypothetical protein CMF22_11725 [Idiomarinaceae bacterium]|nr:hypothetical protein [Idiomarinaceae bacterium]
MNIKRLQGILSTLDAVGIGSLIFAPEGDGCRIRGIDKDHQVLIFHYLDEPLVEKPMAIQTVKGLLTRLNLFDIDKASVNIEYNDKMATSLQIKMGRKKAGFTFVRPESLPVPQVIPMSEETIDPILLSEEYVEHLSSVISAMAYTGDKKERYLSIEVNDDRECTLSVFDGEDDSYVDEILNAGSHEPIRCSWDVPAFNLVMKNSMKMDEEKIARLTISEYGVATFSLGDMVAMVSPLSTS